MSSSFEKSVKGATKIKAAPPKSKYIEHILIATHSGEAGVAEVFRVLQNRLRDSTWTVVFKSLITVHLMIREGSPDTTLAYLSKHKSMLSISNFADVQTQGRNIRHYSNYLIERARAYKETKCDFVRGAEKRLEKMSVDKGLLRETETVQHQITALLKCDVLDSEPENEITITVFRMLVLDLLAMFHVMNQAMINILGHFFEMSRPDAERAMEIYKNFTKQTDFVVAYLSTARSVEHQTRVEVPKLKHAPVNLGRQLEDYLKDPDFEINRRQYLAEQDGKKGRNGNGSASKAFATSSTPESASQPTTTSSFSAPAAASSSAPKPSAPKGPDPDLIDFFESIEQNQQPLATQPGLQQQGYSQFQNNAPFQQPQQQFTQNNFPPQQQNLQNPGQYQDPYAQSQQPQLQPSFTGAGFGGYTPQQQFQPGALSSIPQNGQPNFQSPPPQQQISPPQMLSPQQTTNPFRLSMMATGASQQGFASPPQNAPSPVTQQSTNPFAKSSTPPVGMQQQFSPPPAQQIQQQIPDPQPQFQSQPNFLPPTAAPLRPTPTGTNPFAKNLSQRPQTSGGLSPPQALSPQQGLVPQPTGSTNPFRQSQFVNTATGQAWQNQTGPGSMMGGGLDSLETVPVFPRPSNTVPWGQGGQQQ